MSKRISIEDINKELWSNMVRLYSLLTPEKIRNVITEEGKVLSSHDVFKRGQTLMIKMEKIANKNINYGVVLEAVGRVVFRKHYLPECLAKAAEQGIDLPAKEALNGTNLDEYEKLLYNVFGEFKVITIYIDGKKYYRMYEDLREENRGKGIWLYYDSVSYGKIPAEKVVLSGLCECENLKVVRKFVDLRISVYETDMGKRYFNVFLSNLSGLSEISDMSCSIVSVITKQCFRTHNYYIRNHVRGRDVAGILEEANKTFYGEKKYLVDAFSPKSFSVRHVRGGSRVGEIGVVDYASVGDGKFSRSGSRVMSRLSSLQKEFISEVVNLYNRYGEEVKEIFVFGDNCSEVDAFVNDDKEWSVYFY